MSIEIPKNEDVVLDGEEMVKDRFVAGGAGTARWYVDVVDLKGGVIEVDRDGEVFDGVVLREDVVH